VSPAQGRFTEPVMAAAMHRVADAIGVDSGGAQLLQLTNNAVYALPTAGLVIRIARSHRRADRVAKTVALGRWFAGIDAPTIRLAGPTDQPVPVDELLATVWAHLPRHGERLGATDLGHALRHFHRLGTPPFPLPLWDPVKDALRRIDDAEALPDRDRQTLLDWCHHLRPSVMGLARGSTQLIHGDAHASNLLREPTGRIVFCDFDATCLGPWQADLVAVPVGEARFGPTGAHQRLAAAYGYDVLDYPHWPLLRAARELTMVVAAVPLLASAPGVADEFHLRLRSITDPDPGLRWTPFAKLVT
jgi:aminoglycoside phosphotransferase (APT) family kinase protein